MFLTTNSGHFHKEIWGECTPSVDFAYSVIWAASPFMHICICIHIQKSFPYLLIYIDLSPFIRTAICHLSTMRTLTQADQLLHVVIPSAQYHSADACTFFVIVHAPGSSGRMCTFQEAHSGGQYMAKNEIWTLDRVGQETYPPLQPASPDHMDAIRNANIWPSISMALDTPNMTGQGCPNFFWFQCFQR